MALLRVFFFLLLLWSNAYGEPERVISLAPNVTEILYAISAKETVIAVSDFCNYPPEVKTKPKVGGMLNPSYEKILSLSPDLVILSREGTPFEVYERLKNLGLKVYVFNGTSISNLGDEIVNLGRVLRKTNQAKKVADDMDRRIKSYRDIYSGERALFIVWTEPLTVASDSSHIGEIMKLIGLRNVANNSLPYYTMNIEQIIRLNPEIIFIGEGHGIHTNSLLMKLKDTKAVREGKVFTISESIYRLSPRIEEGIREMIRWKR